MGPRRAGIMGPKPATLNLNTSIGRWPYSGQRSKANSEQPSSCPRHRRIFDSAVNPETGTGTAMGNHASPCSPRFSVSTKSPLRALRATLWSRFVSSSSSVSSVALRVSKSSGKGKGKGRGVEETVKGGAGYSVEDPPEPN